MADTPLLTQRFVHPDVSPSSTATPSATPDDTMPALAPGQKDKLGRVMIEPDGSSWHPAKDAARTLKDCVRRLYTQAYHTLGVRSQITMCTWESRYNLVIGTTFERKASAKLSSWLKKVRDSDKFKAILDQVKKARGSLKGGSLHTRGAKTVGTINNFHQYVAENLDSSVQLTAKLSTQIWKEKVVGGTYKGRVYGIGSSRQAEALDGVKISAMSDQIAKLTMALAESERRRVAEQESMSETVQQIKEQEKQRTA
ncbi:hypothetical protein H5410_061360 [Solanum commersonii]|uniref:Uncharacterized protein n=1 Tax=Solanum commersonii TaxID=4109 RepID=A0A9J5W7S4_SOLCO|nr:hypothetical protein H5410_061360 [Solanum commersonii]